MAKRNKRSASDEMANFLVEAIAGLVKWSFIGVAYLLKYLLLGVWSVLKAIGNGIKWVAAKNKEESIRLDARRHELWEERWAKWSHEDQVEDVEEEEDILPDVIEMAQAVEVSAPVEEVEEDLDEDDPEEIEKEIKRQVKRLTALRNKEDKMRSIHSTTDAEWERYEKTVAWRSLQWDIRDAEMRLEYLERTA